MKYAIALMALLTMCGNAAAEDRIAIKSAVWASKGGEKDGVEKDSTFRAVQHGCRGKTLCIFPATSDWFTNNDPEHKYVSPSPHSKHLDVGFVCEPSQGNNDNWQHAEADEGNPVHVACN